MGKTKGQIIAKRPQFFHEMLNECQFFHVVGEVRGVLEKYLYNERPFAASIPLGAPGESFKNKVTGAEVVVFGFFFVSLFSLFSGLG